MTRPDLELELRDHYLSFDGGSPGAASRVAAALDRAPARRRWSIGPPVSSRAFVVACSAFVVVALVAAALLLPRHEPSAAPGASSTTSPEASGTPVATPTATPFVQPTQATPMPTIDPAVAKVDDAGMTQTGVIWALRGSVLDISTDHGRKWRESSLPAAASSIDEVAVIDADHAFVAVGQTTPGGKQSKAMTKIVIYRTGDGGATWQASQAGSVQGDVGVRLRFADASSGFAIFDPATSGPSTIVRTTDGGATWTVTTSVVLDQPIEATNADTLWLGGIRAFPGRPLLRVSRDGGATWSDVQLPGVGAKTTEDLGLLETQPEWPGAIQFVGPNEAFLAVEKVLADDPPACEVLYYQTLDGGNTWSQVAVLPLKQCPLMSPIFLDATHWLQADKPIQGAHLLATSDGGQTWTPAGDARALYNAWTIDGQSWSKMDQIDPDSNIDHSYFALFISWDGGVTWQPADFSAR